MLCFYLLTCVQIIVESFPISSSGHWYLLLNLLKKFDNDCANIISHQNIFTFDFLQSFDYVLHAVMLIVLSIFFFDRWKLYLVRMQSCLPIFFKVVCLTALADMVTGCFYLFFKMYPVEFPLVVGFGITAVSLLSLYFINPSLSFVTFSVNTENTQDERKGVFVSYLFKFYSSIKNKFSSPLVLSVFHLDEKCNEGWRGPVLTPSKALILGLIQGIALLPGISRLATTYAAARWLGLQPRKAFEVSWLIAVPLFLAASMQGAYTIWNMPQVHELLVGSFPYIIGAGFIAYAGLKFTAHLLYTNRAWWFGVYMVLPICLAFKNFY